ncbi:hypothetical protein OG204_34640 [Streptomyces sp. NBC_01387]|uniref:hypothetical protein n=1 Tax=unclassified Streptomyces TaxID=2593676 RepID=UPI00225A1002|nr:MULTISPECIES: hypothetical protein [unclassified Streptomyces]MCX4553259.1 hypothetical protein [Streptomyces sp. NBC_01500]WSC24888.1 hypothetical protein OIE60_00460 [Streptomyces sp. NBC_01766]
MAPVSGVVCVLLALVVQVPRAAADDAVICGHHVQGAILVKYQEMGGEKPPLKAMDPLTNAKCSWN